MFLLTNIICEKLLKKSKYFSLVLLGCGYEYSAAWYSKTSMSQNQNGRFSWYCYNYYVKNS